MGENGAGAGVKAAMDSCQMAGLRNNEGFTAGGAVR
jgi:hypothetical protein